MFRLCTPHQLVVLMLLFSTGCAFTTVTRDSVLPASFDRVGFVRSDPSRYFNSFERVRNAVAVGLQPVSVPENGDGKRPAVTYTCVAAFLHLPDPHIRDEMIQAQKQEQLLWADRVVPVSIRNPLVEGFDSLIFTAFLTGYAKDARETAAKRSAFGPHPFILLGGDLLDTSLITDLVEAMKIMRAFAAEYGDVPLYSTGGNHDGLFFGNVPDTLSDTGGLGVNRTEFVLGHMLADRVEGRGFGFGQNEIVKQFYRTTSSELKPPGATLSKDEREWWELVGRQCSDIGRSARQRAQICKSLGTLSPAFAPSAFGTLAECCCPSLPLFTGILRPAYEPRSHVEELLSIPSVFRNAIYTDGEGDVHGLKCGYYSWREPVHGVLKVENVRYVALDTRSSLLDQGSLDDVQMGWLYNELAEAAGNNECVIIFAHHSPESIERPRELRNLLGGFPNIAAYICGHSHVKKDPKIGPYGNCLYLETESCLDFPQAARKVEIWLPRSGPGENSAMEVRVRCEHVRPAGDTSRSDGLLLQAILDATLRDAKKDYGKWSVQRSVMDQKPCKVYETWVKANLAPESCSVTIRFPREVPKPEQFFSVARINEIRTRRNRLGLTQRDTSPNRPRL